MIIICIILGALSAGSMLTMYACCVGAGEADRRMEEWEDEAER